MPAASSFEANKSSSLSARRRDGSIPTCGTSQAGIARVTRPRPKTLIREVADELGATAQAFEEIAVLEELHPDEHGEARYHVFVVTVWEGREPRMLDSEQVVGVSGR